LFLERKDAVFRGHKNIAHHQKMMRDLGVGTRPLVCPTGFEPAALGVGDKRIENLKNAHLARKVPILGTFQYFYYILCLLF